MADLVYADVEPSSLYVTHIVDGEEVVRGGDDGQTWVATFASAAEAFQYIDRMRDGPFLARGIRPESDARETMNIAPQTLQRSAKVAGAHHAPVKQGCDSLVGLPSDRDAGKPRDTEA